MEFRGFKLFPAEGRLVELGEQRIVGKILEDAKVLDRIPHALEVIVEVGRTIESNLGLAAAHQEWRESYFPDVETPKGLPRQPFSAKTESGLVHVTVRVIERYSPGMGSHFGFRGYFLSILLSLSTKTIWDARGETAS